MEPMAQIPDAFADLAAAVVKAAEADERILGITVNGSAATGGTDEYSDLDLVIVSTDEAHRALLGEAKEFAAGLGELLTAFTGEHVGEPRVLITLYGSPPRHVDLKFVGVSDLDHRVEDGVVLWERGSAVTKGLANGLAEWPQADPQWIEDRFWVWVHYVGAKIGRGELFEAVDALTMMRGSALAPLAIAGRVDRPAGVRRIERIRPDLVLALAATVPTAERDACLRALDATVELYRQLRDTSAVEARSAAEEVAVAYVRSL